MFILKSDQPLRSLAAEALDQGRMPRGVYSAQTGFTLLELLIVIAMLSSLALMSVFFVESADDQARFELTRARWGQMRYAMVGDANRVLNGETELYGFVADMGRLPNNVQELVEPPVDVSMRWQARDIPGVTEKIWAGWRGPYLMATPETSGPIFRDGWGTAGSAPNYGWQFEKTDTSLTMKSLGKDAKLGGEQYAEDYPTSGALLEKEDWSVALNGRSIPINFNKPPPTMATAWALKLTLYFFNGATSGAGAVEAVDSDPLLISGSEALARFADDELPVPMGKYAAVLWCVSSATPPIADKLFNGDCTATNPTHALSWITLLPRRDHNLTMNWTIN